MPTCGYSHWAEFWGHWLRKDAGEVQHQRLPFFFRPLPFLQYYFLMYNLKKATGKKSCWPWKRACFTSPQGTSPSAAVWRSNTNEGFAVTLVAVVSKQTLNLGATISTKIIYVRSKISETAQMRLLRTSRLFQKHLPQMCVSCWALIREKHPVTCISISFKSNWNLTKGCVGARDSGLTCLTPGRRVLFGVNCPALMLECSTFFPLCNDNY